MPYIIHTIKGVPYGADKTRGNVEAAEKWTDDIRNQTQGLQRVKQACIMKVTFLLPGDKYPDDYPYGSDLDNLLKRFMDALNKTVFSEAKGKDSCVVSVTVTKTRVASPEEAGAHFEILPVEIP